MKQGEKAASKVGSFFKGAFKKIESQFDKMVGEGGKKEESKDEDNGSKRGSVK